MKRRAPGEGARATDASDYSATLDASFFTERPSHRPGVCADIQPRPLRYMCLQCFATETVRRARETDYLDQQSELIFDKLRRWSDDSFAWILAIELSLDGVQPCLDAESCSFCGPPVCRHSGVLKDRS